MKKHHSLLLFSSCVLVGGIGGFLIGQQNQGSPGALPKSSNSLTASSSAEQLLRNKTATFEGEIIRYSDSVVQLKDSEGRVQAFPIDEQVLINKSSANGAQSSPSADLKQIETGRKAYIFFRYMDGQYKVNYISFLPK